jgi:hypothetical protein
MTKLADFGWRSPETGCFYFPKKKQMWLIAIP